MPRVKPVKIMTCSGNSNTLSSSDATSRRRKSVGIAAIRFGMTDLAGVPGLLAT
jgi:hypothetical protein